MLPPREQRIGADVARVARRARLLVVGLAALTAAAPTAHGATIGGVRLTVNDHGGPRIALSRLLDNQDVPPFQATTLRTGGSSSRDTHSGTSAARLLTLAGLDPAHVRTLSIGQPLGASAAVLLTAEIVGGFPDGPAVFETYNSTEVHFFRPQHDAGDVNARDAVDPPLRTDMQVAVTTDGGALGVTATADRTAASVGEPVVFSASALAADGAVTYAWDFGDGADATSTTGAAAHAYATAATYDAVVTAYTRSGDSGVAIVHVQVDPPDGAPSGERAGGGGSIVQRGGGHGGRGAPSSGRARGRTRGPVRQGVGLTQQRVGPADDDARVHDAPTRTQAGPPPARRFATALRAGHRAHASSRVSRPRSRHRGDVAPTRAIAPRVSGVLLATSGAPASVLAGLAPEARAPRLDPVARAAASDGTSLGWWLLGGLALAALLALGAAREAGVRIAGRSGAAA